MQLPDSAMALIDELDKIIPERVPEVNATMEDIQRYAGKRELVLLLKHWRDAAKKDPVVQRSRR